VYPVSNFIKICPVGAVLIHMDMQKVRCDADRDLMRCRVNEGTVQALEIISTLV
jgi:hypothetical protein